MTSEKTYAEFKKEIETIRKSISKIPVVRKCPKGKHYSVDKDHDVVFYDPQNNQNGKSDNSIDDAIKNMKKVAAQEKSRLLP